MVSMPSSRSSLTMRSMGNTSAVALLTWLTSAYRVRGETRPRMATRTSSASLTGKGTGAITTRAPARSATARAALRHALYSWSVARISSPGSSASERSAVLTPVVALGRNARSAAGAPRNVPSTSRARSSSGSNSDMNTTGSRSIRSRQAVCDAETACGVAP